MNNLETVKPGDLVTIIRWGNPSSICAVKRVTETTIIVGNDNYETAWRKRDGNRVGSSRGDSSMYMRLYAPEDREYIRRQNLIYKVIHLCTPERFVKLTSKQLDAVYVAVYKIMSDSDQSAATQKGGQK